MGARLNRSPTSHSYTSQRLRLHYCDWGNPDKPTMLLVHGMQDHARTWDWFVESFVDDYHIVAPDLRGHGDSAWCMGSGYSHLDYVYDLSQLVRQGDLGPLTLVGHSLGGTLACLYAGKSPERVARLVCIEGIGLWPDRFAGATHPELFDQWVEDTHALAAREPRRYPTLQSACERMQKMNPNLSQEQAQHLTRHGANQNEDGSWSWKFDNYTHNWPPYGVPVEATLELWQNILCPTLIINAENGYEHRIGHGDSLDQFSNAQLEVIANAGHWTYHDQLDAVVTTTRQFLSANPLNRDH